MEKNRRWTQINADWEKLALADLRSSALIRGWQFGDAFTTKDTKDTKETKDRMEGEPNL